MNHIDVSIQFNINKTWLFTGFYGAPVVKNKSNVWNILIKLSLHRNQPWLVCDDLNEIMFSFEKKVGVPKDER